MENLDNKLEEIYKELDARLLHAVNGRVPDLLKTEIRQVLLDLGLSIISNTAEFSFLDYESFGKAISDWSTPSLETGSIELSQVFHQLKNDGWIILPPR
jgi:hypothetical protein